MTCFITYYFDETLISLIAQHWWQTMLKLSGDKNLIKSFRRAYTMSLVFDSMWMTLYNMLDPEESCKINFVLWGKRSCINYL